MKHSIPLLKHHLEASTAFSPESVVEAVRAVRNIEPKPVPPVCVLEFDGDLTDWLVSNGKAKPWKAWACFHSTMFSLKVDEFTCGIVPRAIGGPYAVLIAEQMRISGARVVLGLTSAGCLSSKTSLPGIVVVTRAIRDEGTSYHYIPPKENVDAPPDVARFLESELKTMPLSVLSGTVWTTDAPYRETKEQLAEHAETGALAVEMQAASLFAFAEARRFPVGIVAHVTNRIGQAEEPFDKGSRGQEFEILKRVCRAGNRFVASSSS